MTLRFTIPAFALFACQLAACGGGSTLDDYQQGVPDVVPSPVRSGGSSNDGAKDGEVGASCGRNSDCDDRDASCLEEVDVVVTSVTFDGGYCTVNGCQTADDCPSDTDCFPAVGACLRTCTDNSACREDEGYECAAGVGGSTRFCLPQALADLGSLGGGATGGFIGGLGGLLGGGATGGFIGGLGGGANAGGGGTGGFIGGLGGGGDAGGAGGFIGGLLGSAQPEPVQ